MVYRHSQLTCIKYLFCGINLLLVLAGVIVVSVAASVYSLYSAFSDFSHDSYFSTITIMTTAGAFIMVVGCLGYYGILKEKSWIILMFVAVMSLMTLMEFCAAVIISSSQNDITSAVETKMWEHMKAYQTNNDTALLLDSLQETFSCCGVVNATDWTEAIEVTSHDIADGDVPMSCCKPEIGAIGEILCNTESENLRDRGCLDLVAHYIGGRLTLLGDLGIGIVIVQVISIGYSIYLALKMRRYGR